MVRYVAVRKFGLQNRLKKILTKQRYILTDDDGADYFRSSNGNALRPVAFRSLITNDLWATPPIIA
ncbi:hypothetical protein Pst134EA_019190 [Puccinia striiformis f. sp. tritici]|uniref:hypothetical protein n=1 Tax=Puccinia striiformis f. sp. tritici TaxID=168172 RepID=UPI00200896EF|nr:hypothetical protein Pst134EA_019190 [Puccinia striiformis f. sp. tritici]KAH9459040.1 hypothetical protein Pst134EA_019190 [Puccinia striiformis f. sp. tritici]